MCCPSCKGQYAYTEDPHECQPGKIPDASKWRYMDGSAVVAGTAMYCEFCRRPFQPMLEDIIIEG